METPSFLQPAQNLTDKTSKNFFGDRKKLLSILSLVVLVLGIPLAVWLLQKTQIFAPKAEIKPIELVTGGDSCVVSTDPNKVTCSSFPVKLTSPLGPPLRPHPEPGATCTADNQCPQEQKCFNHQSFPGTCRPVDTVCTQVITTACGPVSSNEVCVDFPTPCHVPPGWIVQGPNRSPSPSPTSSPSPSPSPSQSLTLLTSPSSATPSHNNGSKSLLLLPQKLAGLFSKAIPLVRAQDLSGFNPDPGGSLMNGLLSYYKLDEAVGTVVADSKNANNGTATGTNIVDGKIVKGRQFGASSDKIATSNVNLDLSDLTVTGWIQPTDTGPTWNVIASQWGSLGTTNASWNFSYSTGYKLHFHPVNANCKDTLGDITTPMAVVTPVANKWYFVAVTRNATSGLITFYVDGLPVYSATSGTGPLCKTQLPIVLGQFPWDSNQRMVGKLDEVGIWNRALTAAEITTLYNGGQGNTIGVNSSPSPTASPSGSACTNLVKNFSFENPAVVNTTTSNSWQIYGAPAASTFAVTENIPDWDPRVASGPYQVEIQRALKGPAAEGLQYAEIDVPGIVSLTQSVPTQAGQQYQIKFVYSSRPDLTNTQKLGVYWNGTQVGTIDGTTHGPTGTDWKEKTFTVDGVAGTSKLGFGALADSSNGAGNFIDNISVTQTTGLCGTNPSVSPSPENLPGTQSYKIAESEAGLANAPLKQYSEHPIIDNFTFQDQNPGTKQIWVEFIGFDGSSKKEHISVELIEPEPIISSLDCTMDIAKQNLKITMKGSKLGNGSGKITANGKDAQILTWSGSEVTATIKPDGNLEDGKLFKVLLTRSDGKILPETTCLVNTTILSLGARLFCREPGKFDVSGVKVTLVDENGSKVNEEVTIDKDGLIKGLKTKFQSGKRYSISVKAPYSLRRNAQFTAADGTNVITPTEEANFILPVGDISPVIQPDGKINTLDRAEIIRQWSVLGIGSGKTGDFNRDTKVNSIDWACMRFDFNKEDDLVPTKASTPLPSPTLTSSPNVSASPSPSPSSVSPTPQASGQRSAFFLLEPVGGGSYPNGNEFTFNINISTQNEAANLFVAKLSFDPASLEVVRIEKGTKLTSWAEEFFDNPTGKISLAAGLPNPGLKTAADKEDLMAKVIFKGKKVGTTTVSVTPDSKIYSNSDNANILTDPLSAQEIAITE